MSVCLTWQKKVHFNKADVRDGDSVGANLSSSPAQPFLTSLTSLVLLCFSDLSKNVQFSVFFFHLDSVRLHHHAPQNLVLHYKVGLYSPLNMERQVHYLYTKKFVFFFHKMLFQSQLSSAQLWGGKRCQEQSFYPEVETAQWSHDSELLTIFNLQVKQVHHSIAPWWC